MRSCPCPASRTTRSLTPPPLTRPPALLQIVFGAMFAYADAFYNGPVATFAHAVMSATLTQARPAGRALGGDWGIPLGAAAEVPCCGLWVWPAAAALPGQARPPHPAAVPALLMRARPACVQAWFPAHAEIWNAPTWFLSALTFAMVVLPHVVRGGRRAVLPRCSAVCASLPPRAVGCGMQATPAHPSAAASSPLPRAAARHC